MGEGISSHCKLINSLGEQLIKILNIHNFFSQWFYSYILIPLNNITGKIYTHNNVYWSTVYNRKKMRNNPNVHQQDIGQMMGHPQSPAPWEDGMDAYTLTHRGACGVKAKLSSTEWLCSRSRLLKMHVVYASLCTERGRIETKQLGEHWEFH